MKTCRHCFSTDIPDDAKRCLHCGRRVVPFLPWEVVVSVLVIVVIAAIAIPEIKISEKRKEDKLASQRSQFQVELDTMKRACSPSSSPDFVTDATEKFRHQVEASSLEDFEQQKLLAVWDNTLQVGGCGLNRQEQSGTPKPRPARPKHRQ